MISFALIWSILNLTSDLTYVHPQTTDPGYLGESRYFRFYNVFWVNYHHFVYLSAKSVARGEKLADVVSLPESEQAQFSRVLEVYARKAIELDLRRSAEMYTLKRWLVTVPEDQDLRVTAGLQVDPELIEALNTCKPIYQKHIWPKHKDHNRAVFETNIQWVRELEEPVVNRMQSLCRQRWQSEPIRVDISYHSKRNRPYTTLGPTTHIVMDSGTNALPAGNWIELLFHEAAHHLISVSTGFVGGTIREVQDIHGKSLRDLWHAYLFYFSGAAVQEVLSVDKVPGYVTYMKRGKVFEYYHAVLERYLPSYLNGTRPLHAVTLDLVQDFLSNIDK